MTTSIHRRDQIDFRNSFPPEPVRQARAHVSSSSLNKVNPQSLIPDLFSSSKRLSDDAGRIEPRCYSFPVHEMIDDMVPVIEAVKKIWHGNVIGAFKKRSPEVAQHLEDDPIDGLDERYINKIRGLWLRECSCLEYDRLTKPFREIYENVVINNIVKEAEAQVKLNGEFSINLTFYCPGKLGGEAVLCTRLYKRLSELGLKGSFNFSLIDPGYQGIVKTGETEDEDFSLALEDFSRVLKLLEANTDIQVGAVDCFESEEEYEDAMAENPSMKHDFFLASDLGGKIPIDHDQLQVNEEEFHSVFCPTGKAGAKVIILYSNEGQKLWINGHEECLMSAPQKSIKAYRIESSNVEMSKRIWKPYIEDNQDEFTDHRYSFLSQLG